MTILQPARGVLAPMTLIATASLVGACSNGGGGGTNPSTPTPTTVTIDPATNNQSATVGAGVANAPSVTVRDQNGNTMSGIAVTFAVASGGGSVTGAAQTTGSGGVATAGGWTLGTTAGANTVTATVTGVSPATFTATGQAGAPAGQSIVAGNNQTAMVGANVATAPRVKVADSFGNGVSGATVTFAVTAGGGSATGLTGSTDANGEFAVGSWTLGMSAGPNTLTASVAGLPDAVFTATGVTSFFTITLNFVSSISSSQQAAFTAAAGRWSQIITGNLSSIDFSGSPFPAGNCLGVNPAFSGTVDDVLIWVEVKTIDGPGGVLGQAGPCAIRNGSPALPVLGAMQFDVADLSNEEAIGRLGDVVLHEMGHVLGFGTLWGLSQFNLLQNPSCGNTGPNFPTNCDPDNAGADTHFTGAQAITAFNALPGGPWMPPTTANSAVPVENMQGGPGTRDGHWRESTFVTELMTGFVSPQGTPNELSSVTVMQFADLGYQVDPLAGDSYTLGNPSGLRAPGPVPAVEMMDDIMYGPMFTVTPGGVTRRIR